MAVPDSVGIFLSAIQSGVVVSGNSSITVARSMTSGDALASFRIGGKQDMLAVRLTKNEPIPFTGSFYTKVADMVNIDVYHHDTAAGTSGLSSSSGSVAIVQRLVNDLKVTVSGFAWSGVPPPKLAGEGHPYAQAQFAHATVTYRVRYLL